MFPLFLSLDFETFFYTEWLNLAGSKVYVKIVLSFVWWVLSRTFHLLPAICFFLCFQKCFLKRTGDQSIFAFYHYEISFQFTQFHFWGFVVLDSFLFSFRQGKPSQQLLICINVRTCPKWLTFPLPRFFSLYSEEYMKKSKSIHLSSTFSPWISVIKWLS